MPSKSNDQLILVVDDDKSIRQLINMALTDLGYNVHEAANGADALALIRQDQTYRPQVILLDMQMPVMDGWKFLPHYREAVSAEDQASIIVMTAAMTAARYATQIKADGYLAKPFTLDDLITLVRQHTGP